MIRGKKGYRGAGILFWRFGDSGQIEVLLGLRAPTLRHAPGVWSLFGGGREAGESAWQNAEREAWEEAADGLDRAVYSGTGFVRRPTLSPRVRIPFSYDFSYFFMQVVRQPPDWPRLNWEHSECGWWPVDQLPRPVHEETAKLVGKLRGLL